VAGENKHFDAVIFGSGFSGSIMAMVLRRLGRSVLMIERGAHPRFVIGESSTPFANLLLEQLAKEYDLPFLRSLSEWGTWQAELPQISCGLKRGFTFYHHQAGREVDLADRAAQLLVAASPNDRVADTHWYRPEFDQFLAEQAQAIGVEYQDRTRILECARQGEGWRVAMQREGADEAAEVSAGFVIDATGAKSFLAQKMGVEEIGFSSMPKTRAAYAHFEKVARFDGTKYLVGNAPPYPPDDAAVHHFFEGGWVWVLRFNNGLTSAGVAFDPAQTGLPEGDPEGAWRETLRRFPSIQAHFHEARAVTPFFDLPRISFRRERAAGIGWALLPSAAGFVDPLLSTGFALTLLGIVRIAEAFKQAAIPAPESLAAYEGKTFEELDAAAELVSALYAKSNAFSEFVPLSLLYFAAMSYTETVWRLGHPQRAAGFLLTNDTKFSEQRAGLCTRARSGGRIERQEVERVIESINIAGLADPARRNWHPADARDVIASRSKLECSEEELRVLLAKMGAEYPVK